MSEPRLRRTLAEHAGARTVGSLVDRRPVVYADQPLMEAVLLMDQWETRQLAVVERAQPTRIVGILTMSDIVRAQARAVRAPGSENAAGILGPDAPST